MVIPPDLTPNRTRLAGDATLMVVCVRKTWKRIRNSRLTLPIISLVPNRIGLVEAGGTTEVCLRMVDKGLPRGA